MHSVPSRSSVIGSITRHTASLRRYGYDLLAAARTSQRALRLGGLLHVDVHGWTDSLTAQSNRGSFSPDVLRHELGLTGTYVGCEHGVCVARTVLRDGEAVRACLMSAVQVDGYEIRTVEGLSSGSDPDDPEALGLLQHAFREDTRCGVLIFPWKLLDAYQAG